MSRILIGTSGYSYSDWIGPVYPPQTKQSDFLKLYAREFGMTELNFTYYRQPQSALTKRMAAITGPDFLFSVKAHKSLTHETAGADFQGETAAFMRGIAPFAEAGKLGVVLLQFPYSFHYDSANRRYLDTLCSVMKELPLAVEFRNSGWQHESVYAGLRDRRIATVCVDEPQLPKLLRPSSVVTSEDIAYVRFHGRNKENWWKGDNTSRYDYLYNDEELSEWIPRISEMAAHASLVMIAFNNHFRGQAVQNARRLKEIVISHKS